MPQSALIIHAPLNTQTAQHQTQPSATQKQETEPLTTEDMSEPSNHPHQMPSNEAAKQSQQTHSSLLIRYNQHQCSLSHRPSVATATQISNSRILKEKSKAG